MKKLFLSLTMAAAVLAGFVSCGMSYSTTTSTKTASPSSATQLSRQNQEQMQVTTRVLKALSARDLRIAVHYAYPASGQTITLDSGYEFRIHDGQLDSRLPFYGVSTRASYGGDVSIVFEKAAVERFTEDNSKALAGKYVRTFLARSTDGEYTVTLTVWDNARAEITCQSPDRTVMRYAGELLFE